MSDFQDVREALEKLSPGLLTVEVDKHFDAPGDGDVLPDTLTIYAGRSSTTHGYNLLGRIPRDECAERNLRSLADIANRAPAILAAYDAALQREQAWKDRFRAIVGEVAPDSAGNAVLTLQRERDAYRKANESVAVCAAHIFEVTHTDAIPCLVCHAEAANKRADTAERELDRERQKWAEMWTWVERNGGCLTGCLSPVDGERILAKMKDLDAEERPAPKPEPPRIGWVAEGRYYVCQRCGATSKYGEDKIVHSAECQRQSGEDQRCQ